MPPLNINAARLGKMAEAIAGAGTAQAKIHATAPGGSAEYIVNFFTCSAVRDALTQQYNHLEAALKIALHTASEGFKIPEHLTIDDGGYRITFSLPAERHNPAGPVVIRISNGNESVTTEVNKEIYCRICTALLIRHRSKPFPSAIILTNEGRINLRDANLQNINLCGANLQDADMENANMEGARLDDANLDNANLKGANLNHASLQRASLKGANLQNSKLVRATMQEALLQHARLDGTCLDGANLSNANLEQAELSQVYLLGANLSGAVLKNLSGSEKRLNLSALWHRGNLDLFLNHINNPVSGSLLTMMDSIDNQYTNIKLQMARELIIPLQCIDTSSVTLPLLEVLSKAPWNDDHAINIWLDRSCQEYLSRYNALLMPRNSAEINRQLARLFVRQPGLMYSCNGAFIQLVARMINAENADDRATIARLYNQYLEGEKLSPYTALAVFGGYGAQEPDWDDRYAANFILISPQPDGPVMLLSQHTLQGMLEPDAFHPVWRHFYLYSSPEEELSPARASLVTLFSLHFPLFNEPYKFAQQQAGFQKLLTLIKPGDLYELFISATRTNYSQTKLVSEEDQKKLQDIFTAVLDFSPHSGSYTLKEEHYQQIISAYGLSSAGDDRKARTLLALTAFFTKYSSSAIFGTEENSPHMLRFYACALMEKACALDKRVFSNGQQDKFTDWQDRLLGLNGAFSCSAALSFDMVSHLRCYFPDVVAGIMPPAWA